MNKNSGQTTRPSYGRVLMSEAKKFLEDLENEDSPDASIPHNVATNPGDTDPPSGVLVDVANKENRVDYAYQHLGSGSSDLLARNSVHGPARLMTASNQAHRPKTSVLLPSKPVARAENIHYVGPSSASDAARPTALFDPRPHYNSQSVADRPRDLSLNPQLTDKTRVDAAAKSTHCSLAEERKQLQTPFSQLQTPFSQLQTPFSQKHVGYSRVPVSCQKPLFDDDDDIDDFGRKTSVRDVSHSVEDFENSFLGFVEPTSAVKAMGDEGNANKNPLTALNFSELMASLDLNKQKAKKQRLDSIMTDHHQKPDHNMELASASDTSNRSVHFAEIDFAPPRPQNHTESSIARENLSLPFRLDKSASASSLITKRSRPVESIHDFPERHLSEAPNTVEAYRKPAHTLEMSNGEEIHRRCVRNVDSANVFATQERLARSHEFISGTGGLCQKSLVNREASNTLERSQRSTLVRDGQIVGSASQRLANGACPVTNPPRSVSSLLPDMKTLVINGNTYVLLRVIGKGGSSKVYKGIGPDCKDCAVKCVSFANAEESMIAGYRNEIRLLQQLQNSEEVVKLYDYMFDEDANMLYVAMECGEMDLQTFFRMKESQMRILRMFIRPYWIQMLNAVQVLHKQGIVHSDLKPANFIVVCGRIKLIDFGIARTVLPDCTSVLCDEIVGTFNYISPEAVTDLNSGRDLTGESKPNVKISTRSDVWSLGCILYYLVYSHTPFEHVRNPIMKLQAITNPGYKIEYPPTKIPHVVDVMKKCLDRNPKSRPTIEELLEHSYVTSD